MAAALAPAARGGVGAPEAAARRGGGLRAKQAGAPAAAAPRASGGRSPSRPEPELGFWRARCRGSS